jgi:hypothetical protein
VIRLYGVPYRQARAGHVHLTPWQLLVEGREEPLPEAMPRWDYSTDLSIRRSGTIDIRAVRQECGLAPDDPLRLAAIWQSRGSALRGKVCSVNIPPGADAPSVTLEGRLSGRDLAGTLDITTMLLLARPRTSPVRLVATKAGSTLWEDMTPVALEGTASRFPMEVVDFAKMPGVPAAAAWYLDSAHVDLHRSFLGSVRLLLNANCEAVVRAASSQAPTAEDRAIRSAIHYDVGRMLVRRALSEDELLENPDAFDAGTVGATLAALLAVLFSADPVRAVRDAMLERPEYFDSVLQEKLRLFRE